MKKLRNSYALQQTKRPIPLGETLSPSSLSS